MLLAWGLLLLSALLGAVAHGQTVTVNADVTFASKHYVERTGGEFNETNPGLFVTTRFKQRPYGVGIGVGAYRNSFDRTALSAALRLSVAPYRWLRLGASFGGVTGYGAMEIGGGPFGMAPLFTQSVRVGPPETQAMLIHMGGAFGFGVSFNGILTG